VGCNGALAGGFVAARLRCWLGRGGLWWCGWDGSQAEVGDGIGVFAELQRAEDLHAFLRLIAQAEDEQAGFDFFRREKVEAAVLFAQGHFDGCGGGAGAGGQGCLQVGVAGLVEGGEPPVEQVPGGRVGDEAELFSVAWELNEDGGVDGRDVVSAMGGAGSVGGVAYDDGVDLVGVVFLVFFFTWGDGVAAGCAGGS